MSSFDSSLFARLMAVIEDRKANPPEKSYTTSLLAGGVPKIGGKITEEAREVVEAASEPGDQGRTHLIHEAGDLLYHLFVLLAHREIKLEEVEAELARRFGVSGIDEKASRTQVTQTVKLTSPNSPITDA
jgi:phosphoribosyl-ATP pyrophosphohydrolase